MASSTHWLRGNESEWSPRWVAFLDAETYPIEGDKVEEHRLRLWVASCVDRRPAKSGVGSVVVGHGSTRAGLGVWINEQMVGKRNLWLFAHNLGFDLAVSRLPDELHRLGWTMGDFRFAGRNASGYLTRRGKTIWLVDSASWWPQKLEAIGRDVGAPKGVMPAWEASEDDWLAYCEQDVVTLQTAVLDLLAWWDRAELGHFTKTGPGCGWNAMRHMSPNRMFLVNTEPQGVAHDRLAVCGGRRDVTRVGPIPGGPFALIDFSNAHLTVAAHCLLPKARLSWHESYQADDVRIDGNRFGVIAECLVDTPVPRYPLRTKRGVFYPVGRFKTVLASPEIVWARESGHLVEIGPGFTHDLGLPLQRFGLWALGQLEAATSSAPAVAQLAIKQWGRAVPGKFAGRKGTKYDRGPALWPSWHLEPGTSGPDHLPAVDLHIAGRHWWVVQDQDSDNAYPAVLAWIQSITRVALGKMLEALGDELWVTADTDGAVLDLTRARSWLGRRRAKLGRSRNPFTVAQAVCDELSGLTWPLVPRVKGMSHTLTVAGPQHYEGDTFSKASGRPGNVERDAQGNLHYWAWPGLEWQIQHGSPEGFVKVETAWTEPAITAHRFALTDGRALPVVAGLDGAGNSELLPWRPTQVDGLVHELAERQAPALKGLW